MTDSDICRPIYVSVDESDLHENRMITATKSIRSRILNIFDYIIEFFLNLLTSNKIMVALIHKHSADGSTARGGRHAAHTRDDRTVLELNWDDS